MWCVKGSNIYTKSVNLKKDHVLLHNMSKKCRVCTTPLAHLANSFRLLQWKKDNLFTVCIKVGLSNTNFYFLIIIIIIISIEGEVTCRRYGKVTFLLSPMKFSSNVLKLCLPMVCTQKREKNSSISMEFFISQFTVCFPTAREKRKIETTGVSVKWRPIYSTRSLEVHFSK